MTRTILIHYGNLGSSCIGSSCIGSSCIRPGPFALLSIARFLQTLRLFVAFSFTIGGKVLFPVAVFIRKAGNMSITSLRLSRSRSCRTRTHWQGWFGLTIQVGSELLCKGNQIILCFWLSGMLNCSRIFCCIGSSNPAKKSITSILAGLLASSPISVWRVLNRRRNLSSDS